MSLIANDQTQSFQCILYSHNDRHYLIFPILSFIYVPRTILLQLYTTSYDDRVSIAVVKDHLLQIRSS